MLYSNTESTAQTRFNKIADRSISNKPKENYQTERDGYMAGMDTNSMQPITNSELREVKGSAELSFAEGYLRTTSALGVWPISLFSSLLAMGTLAAFINPYSLNFEVIVSNSLSSFLIAIFTWLSLSWFRWPLVLKLVISTWAAFFAGLLPHILLFQTSIFPMHPGLNTLHYIQSVLAMYGIPSLTITATTVFPYVVTDILKNKILLSKQSTNITQIEETAESKPSSPSAADL